MKVKDNVEIYKVKENDLMNSNGLKQNQRKKTGGLTKGEGCRIKNIACLNSFISYFMNQDKNHSK